MRQWYRQVLDCPEALTLWTVQCTYRRLAARARIAKEFAHARRYQLCADVALERCETLIGMRREIEDK